MVAFFTLWRAGRKMQAGILRVANGWESKGTLTQGNLHKAPALIGMEAVARWARWSRSGRRRREGRTNEGRPEDQAGLKAWAGNHDSPRQEYELYLAHKKEEP